jgi:hypothetical protein
MEEQHLVEDLILRISYVTIAAIAVVLLVAAIGASFLQLRDHPRFVLRRRRAL